MNSKMLGIIATLLLIGAGCSFNSTTNTTVETTPKPAPQTESMVTEGATNTEADMIDGGVEVEVENYLAGEPEEKKSAPGTYEAYGAEKIAFAKEGKVVLFFHAPWCPTCRALETDINVNLSAIPANTKILKVDYESESELKKKYGVTYQHTFVQVDAEGNMIKKWSGGNTLASLAGQIQ